MTMPDRCPLLVKDYASWCPAEILDIDLSTVRQCDQCPAHITCSHTAQQLAQSGVPVDSSVFWNLPSNSVGL